VDAGFDAALLSFGVFSGSNASNDECSFAGSIAVMNDNIPKPPRAAAGCDELLL